MRLIDADELITAFPCGETVRTESVRATIKHMPTIEERKTGKWIDTDTVWTAIIGDNGFNIPAKMCSECKKPIAQIMWNNFCPNCGTQMKGDQT